MAKKVLRHGNRFVARVRRRYFSEGEKRRPEMRLRFAGYTFLRIPRKPKNRKDLNLSKTFCISLRFLNLFISTQVSKLAKKQIKQAEKIQLSMEMTPLLQDNSEDTASTSYHLGDEV